MLELLKYAPRNVVSVVSDEVADPVSPELMAPTEAAHA